MRANGSKAWSIALPFIRQWGINTDWHSETMCVNPYLAINTCNRVPEQVAGLYVGVILVWRKPETALGAHYSIQANPLAAFARADCEGKETRESRHGGIEQASECWM
eukprot:SAG11_NODE_10_length_27955_cov_15.365235_25_plen_107_part_00